MNGKRIPAGISLQALICIALLIASPIDAFAQASGSEDSTSVKAQIKKIDDENKQVYRLNYLKSGAICLVSTALDIYAIPNIIKAKDDLSDEELQGINPDILNEIDKWGLRSDPSQRENYYKASDYVLPVIIAGTGLLAVDKKIQKDWLKLLIMYYEMHAITFNIYNFSPFGPYFQNKLRPIVYYSDYFSADERRGGNQRNSMYSGHTATAVASTFFMVKVYSDYHPEIGRKKFLLYAIASVPPLIEGYLRMKALTHFPSDIMIGFAIGAFCGITVPSLHRIRDKEISLGLVPTPAGPGLSFTWHPNYEKKVKKNFNIWQLDNSTVGVR
jgi:membrane-associated phospholipid phosphatase